MAGVEHVLSLGIADPARLGVIGHSAGAFRTNWIARERSTVAATRLLEHVLAQLPYRIEAVMTDNDLMSTITRRHIKAWRPGSRDPSGCLLAQASGDAP